MAVQGAREEEGGLLQLSVSPLTLSGSHRQEFKGPLLHSATAASSRTHRSEGDRDVDGSSGKIQPSHSSAAPNITKSAVSLIFEAAATCLIAVCVRVCERACVRVPVPSPTN
ncbi:hypothetical protein EPR50_G00106830 [Xyrichtys novacula]|uniref:Uncharacterized protein n=1 Tax=Xyrichtys novacula TaxID=13765 RepID=A0AAV1FDW5_XYRNO|nr:hypothetical protein EPR50_G00106830 [Xyrichtys novacula]